MKTLILILNLDISFVVQSSYILSFKLVSNITTWKYINKKSFWWTFQLWSLFILHTLHHLSWWVVYIPQERQIMFHITIWKIICYMKYIRKKVYVCVCVCACVCVVCACVCVCACVYICIYTSVTYIYNI